MKEVIRYGILGAGGHARLVHRLLCEIGGVELVAVCDPEVERAVSLAGQSGAGVYSNFEAMLDEKKMDALVVCIPPFAHTGQEIQAAERGIHLYIAKPIALDMAYAKKVLSAIERNKVLSCVTYGMRYAPGICKAVELLSARPAVLAEGYAFLRVRPGGGRPWIARKSLSLGQMFTQACHVYDIFRYLVGEIVRVSAIKCEGFIPRTDAYDIEDAGVVTLHFASGAIGQVSCTVMSPSGVSGEYGFRITAEDLVLNFSNREGILHIVDGSVHRDDSSVSKSNDCEALMLSRFINAIRNRCGSEILSPYADAVKTLQVGIGVVEALRTGQAVNIPPVCSDK